ncbi:MAG: imidazolonepropionase [Burkholderiales bacterium]|nr:imidazolonepropionase [Burkholderiales bacterium]
MIYDTLIINANALLDLDSLTTSPHTILGIKDGKITLIEQNTSLTNYKYGECIDAKGRLVTPGLIDCHTHLIFAGSRAHEFRQRLDGVTYQEIAALGGGIKATVKATNLATHEELFNLAKQRIQIMQQYGVTTIEVKSGYGLSVSGEMKILEVATALNELNGIDIIPTFLGAHATPEGYTNDEYIDLIIEQMLPKIGHLTKVVDGFCEKIAFTPTQIERLFQHAVNLGFRVKLHAEQLSDQKGSRLASKFAALSVDHLEYLDPVDVKYLAQAGTVAVLLPGAFYFLKETKLPPIKELRLAKVPLAIATDMNPGTSPFLAMPLIMNMGCICLGLTIAEVWKGVTLNAAKALGVEHRVGSISIGKDADFALWECERAEDVVYNYAENYCSGVIKSGQLFK